MILQNLIEFNINYKHVSFHLLNDLDYEFENKIDETPFIPKGTNEEILDAFYKVASVQEYALLKRMKHTNAKKIVIGNNDLNIMKKVHKTAVISTLEDSVELCSYILSQSLEGEDIFEFLEDMESLNSITADEIYEVANKVLNNPTIHILKSS